MTIYSDIDANWVNPTASTVVNWSTGTDDNLVRHQVEMTNQTAYGGTCILLCLEPTIPTISFSEENEMTTSGQVVYATANVAGLTWQTGPGTTIRATFVSTGVLPNTQDAAFRAISDNTPAFGFSSPLGVLKADGTASSEIVYAVGHYRELAVKWSGLGGAYPDRALLFQAEWPGLIPSVSALPA